MQKAEDALLYASPKSKVSINVGVGYGWMKPEKSKATNGREVLFDVFWKTLKIAFCTKHQWLERENATVKFSRLRSSHGEVLWKSILKQIKESDILIFDVAAAPSMTAIRRKNCDVGKKVASMRKNGCCLNTNVLIEIGVAIALKKNIMLLCPKELEGAIPSDLKAYMWTFYKWQGKGDDARRIFVDQYGMQNGYMGMLRKVLRKKTGRNK